MAAYRPACDAAAKTIEKLDTPGKHHSGETVSLRWMILTVLLDTTHAGHADLAREMFDGSHPGDVMVSR